LKCNGAVCQAFSEVESLRPLILPVGVFDRSAQKRYAIPIVSARRGERTGTSRPLARRVAFFHCTSSVSNNPSSRSITTSDAELHGSICAYVKGFWWTTYIRSGRSQLR